MLKVSHRSRKHGQKIDLSNEPAIKPDAKPMRADDFASPYRNLYDGGMKTTLDLDDALLRDAKIMAARQGSSLTRLIEEGLRMRIAARLASARTARIPRLPVSRGKGGLLPGIDPTSNRSMLDAADGI